MTSRVLTLAACAAAFWLLLALPARALFGADDAPLLAGVAVLLALIPGVVTLVWADRAFGRDANQQSLALLGASGVRMFGVLVVALLLHLYVTPFQRGGFLLWVAAAYLSLLAAEVVLVVQMRKQAAQNTTTGA